ncbi:MAG: PKD domain-containing protein [Thermoplasmata archaeon]
MIILFTMLLSSLEMAAIKNISEFESPSDIKVGDEMSLPPVISPTLGGPPGDSGSGAPPTDEGIFRSPHYSFGMNTPLSPTNTEIKPEVMEIPYWKIEPDLLSTSKEVESVNVIITSTDMNEVRELLGFENRYVGSQGKGNDLRLDSSIFELQGNMLQKIASLKSVISIQNYELPKPPQFPEDMKGEVEPMMWNAVKYHGADEAWNLGFNGSGVNVAVMDTGVDFGHPDLNGTQARDENPSSPYYGWPLAFDSRSMNSYLSSGGQGFPSKDNWYSDTSTTDTDSNGNKTLDISGYNVTNITSQSGVYHIGKHPDTRLRIIHSLPAGDGVGVLVVDENIPGVYDTVYVDLDNDNNFTDEKPCRKGDEVSTQDITGDGIPDRSGGMVYFIADGTNPVPYSDIIAAENGYSLPIPTNGSLVVFMINDPTEAGRNHGTLCASAVTGQGVIASGRVKGTAPKAKVIAIGNIYQGGNEIDSYYFAVEGYDGIPGTGDEAQIVSCSFGDSDVIDRGWDFTSRFVDNLTTFYAPNVTFSIASGNGGYGYGTVVSPGSSMGVVTVGAALNARTTEVVYWSNRGPNAVGQVDPDVVSVGVSAFGDQALNQKNNGNSAYQSWSGTSLATPVTAGIIALIYDAYYQAHGEFPTSELSREILMSTADNLNYDPLVQGAGFSNATRATMVASDTSGLLLSPTFWTAGDYRGTDYDGFAHILHPGETDEITISVANKNQNDTMDVFISDYVLSRTETYSVAIVANKSREDTGNSAVPDYIIPLNDSLNGISYIPNDTALLKVSAFLPWDEFDTNNNYLADNTFEIKIYNWLDSNGNGSYWNDTNSDGVVQPAEIESSELTSISSSGAQATTQEARMQNPLQRVYDGILVGIFHYYPLGGSPPEITHFQIQSQCYNRTDWSWLSTNTTNLSIEAGGMATFNASLTVPLSTPIGIYEGMIALNDTENETAMPVIVNVASNSSQFTFGGNTLSSDLYANDQVFGAFRWGWRYEGGDWRFYFTEIPDSFSVDPGTKIVADVKWDNYPTDIDVFLLGGVSDSFSNEMPERFGPYTLDINGASYDAYWFGGRFRFNTTTNGPREIISADLRPGLNEIILHNVLYAGTSFSENVTGTIGTVNVTPYPWDVGLIENVANLTGTQQFELLSSFNLSGITAEAFGVYPPMEYPNQLVYQNVASDKKTANWSKEFDVSGADYIKVNISSQYIIDIDLFLLRDINGNGIPNWSTEQVASSTSPYADEEIILNLPTDGKYWVFVHGWDVPSSPSVFDCYIEVVYGNDINITDIHVGPVLEGEEVYFNASYDLPPIAGEHRGIIIVGLTNLSDTISVPFKAYLEEEKPTISNPWPSNGSWINSSQPSIGAQYYDSGSGINVSGVFIFLDGMNQTVNATISVDSINLTPQLPISDGNHTVYLIVTDVFGNQNSTTWRFLVDNIDPIVDAGADKVVDEDDIVYFNGSASSDENEILNMTWDFADGNFGYGMNPSHSYPQSGTYIVTLIVSDIANNTGIDTLTVFVNNVAPFAEAGNDQTIDEGETAFFNGNVSYDTSSDMSTLIYTWYFDDGSVLFGITVNHVFMDNGIFTVILLVEDDNGYSDSDSINVTVNNVPPTADAGGPYSGNEGIPLTFTGSATDPGTDTLTYEWDFDDLDGLAYTDASGLNPSWTWPDDFSGTIYLRVTDDDGGIGFDMVNVIIDNVAPTADAGGPYSGKEGSPITLTGSASDPGTDTLTYEWDFDDSDGLAYTDASGLNPSWTWPDDFSGTIYLRVTDDDGGIGFDMVNVTINNVAPSAEAGGPYSGNEGGSIALTGTVTDPGTDALTYEWDLDNDGLYDDAIGQNPAWTWDDDGVYIIDLRVTDDDGGVSSDRTTVTISNVAPTANAGGPYEGNESTPITFSGTQTDPGTDDTFFYLWDFGDGDLSTQQNPSHVYADNGVYTVTLTVTDDDGGVHKDNAIAFVYNQPPTVEEINGQLAAREDQLFTFKIDAKDTEGDPLTFTDNTGLFNIESVSGVIEFIPTNDDVGLKDVTITVSDDDGATTTIILLINIVNENDPPTLEKIGPQVAVEDQQYSLTVIASDIDVDDVLTFSDDTDLFDIDPNTGVVSFIPANDQVGIHLVTITVQDVERERDSETFTLTILNTNDAPVLSIIPDQHAKVGQRFTYTVFASDLDDALLTFSDDSGLFMIDPIIGTVSFIPNKEDEGVHIINFTVTDSQGKSDYQTMLLEIEGIPDEEPEIDWLSLILLILVVILILILLLHILRYRREEGKEEGRDKEEVEPMEQRVTIEKQERFLPQPESKDELPPPPPPEEELPLFPDLDEEPPPLENS